MIAIKDMEEMLNACTSIQEILGDIVVTDCPLYNVCKHRNTIRTNYKPSDCPLVEIGTCKDCKKYNRNEMFCTWHGGYLMYTCDPNFYCADFEKRGNETK